MDQQRREEAVEERRTSTRFNIQAPAITTIANKEVWAFTRDISTRAVYFKAAGEETLPIGEFVDFVIKIPPSMVYFKPCFIRGRGRTIRVDDLGGDEWGFVVEILECDIETESIQEDRPA